MAYVLGFFAADGNIVRSRRGTYFLSLEICDKDIIYKIRKLMSSNHKISLRPKKESNHKIRYRIQIGSKEMCEDLHKLGLISTKTYNIRLPKVPQEFFSHFVRGYFDGDGHVWVGKIHKDRRTSHIAIQSVFTSCSKKFMVLLTEQLTSHGINGHMQASCEKTYFRLYYSIRSSLALYELMYKDCENLYLSRKKKVFDKFIKMRL